MPTPTRPTEAKLFRSNRSQAVWIPAEFELLGDRVMIHREGNRLIIEPVIRPKNLVELLTEWRKGAALAPEDLFPTIEDTPAQPEFMFQSKTRLLCNEISYRKGVIEITPGIHDGCINLETWGIHPEIDIERFPDDGITGNTELEMSIEMAEALIEALQAAICAVQSSR